MKVFVLGLDGATFRLIDKWIERLPNFNRLIHEGVRGDLESTVPPHTALAWPSILTGVNPGKHGIFQFWKTQTTDYNTDFYTSCDFRYKSIDQWLNEHGKKVGLVNIPMTHPVRELDGFMISWPLVNTLRYSYPHSLVRELAAQGGHFLHDLATMYSGQEDYHEKAIEFTKKRHVSLNYLLDNYDWDFFFTVFTEIDRVSHYYWKYMDEEHPQYTEDCNKKDAILSIYLETDRVIGELMDKLGEQVVFCVVSDHGFGPGKLHFYVHRWLNDHGYLAYRDGVVSGSETFGENVQRNEYWYLHQIDWSRTTAYMPAPGCYGLNINLKGRQQKGIVDPEDYERLCEELINKLSEILDPMTDEPLFQSIVPRDLVYRGQSVTGAPDLILIPTHYSTMVHHGISEDYFGPAEPSGLHDPKGIFLIRGTMVKRGIRVIGATVADIFPTLLYAMDVPIPADIDGRVLMEAFEPEFIQQKSVRYHGFAQLASAESVLLSTEEKTTIEQRLKNMGYL